MDPLVVGMSLLTQGADQFTGTGTYVRELLREYTLRPEEIRLEALCNEHAIAAFQTCSASNVSLARARGFQLGTSKARRAAALVGARISPGRLARQFPANVDVVHFPLTLGVPDVPVPTVVSLHDVQHHDLPQHFSVPERRWRRVFYDSTARKATLVVTLSEHSKHRIIETLKLDADRVVVIPLAADRQRFHPQPSASDEELLAPMDLPERFFFYPATLWPHKNHIGLLDAFARVPDPTIHLALCGASLGRLEEIRAAATARGVAGRVRHLGFVSGAALPAVYRRATALVFPSTYEGFGAPALEAMASGCPVASSLAGPLAEICANATAVLEPDDPEQMGEVMTAVATDERLRRRLHEAGLDRAQDFSWARSAESHLAAYRRASDTC